MRSLTHGILNINCRSFNMKIFYYKCNVFAEIGLLLYLVIKTLFSASDVIVKTNKLECLLSIYLIIYWLLPGITVSTSYSVTPPTVLSLTPPTTSYWGDWDWGWGGCERKVIDLPEFGWNMKGLGFWIHGELRMPRAFIETSDFSLHFVNVIKIILFL